MQNVKKCSLLPFYDFCIFRILNKDVPSNKGNFKKKPAKQHKPIHYKNNFKIKFIKLTISKYSFVSVFSD